jgi:hypothetical protein
MDGFSTTFLFPAGRSDELFMLVPVFGGEKYWTLSKQTRIAGVVRRHWVVRLRFVGSHEGAAPGAGKGHTLLRVLDEEGVAVIAPAPAAAEEDLQRSRAYAAYWYMPYSHAFQYWFVQPDGRYVGGGMFSTPLAPYIGDFGRPYPVTKEELAWLEARGVRGSG